jgi:hypothetical protein
LRPLAVAPGTAKLRGMREDVRVFRIGGEMAAAG